MSRYAWLACTDCKVMLWLGKAVCSDQNNRISFFHIGTAEEPPNSARPELNRALWKLLADHTQHTFRVVTDQDPEYKALEEYVEIGSDEDRDMAFETFLKGWLG
jgi:hypothetical protein